MKDVMKKNIIGILALIILALFSSCATKAEPESLPEALPLEMISLKEYGLDYAMGKTEVTYAQWHSVYFWAVENGYEFSSTGREGHDGVPGSLPSYGMNEPVTEVSWRDAIVWCNALSEKEGLTPVYYEDALYAVPLRKSTSDESVTINVPGTQDCPYIYSPKPGNLDMSACTSIGYRLPTSREWETAAMADDTFVFAGSNVLEEVGWARENSGDASHEAATLKPNGWGFYDMSGNVWEWVWDLYSPTSRIRLRRGGGWHGDANGCSVSGKKSLGAYEPYFINYRGGFRLCMSLQKNSESTGESY